MSKTLKNLMFVEKDLFRYVKNSDHQWVVQMRVGQLPLSSEAIWIDLQRNPDTNEIMNPFDKEWDARHCVRTLNKIAF